MPPRCVLLPALHPDVPEPGEMPERLISSAHFPVSKINEAQPLQMLISGHGGAASAGGRERAGFGLAGIAGCTWCPDEFLGVQVGGGVWGGGFWAGGLVRRSGGACGMLMDHPAPRGFLSQKSQIMQLNTASLAFSIQNEIILSGKVSRFPAGLQIPLPEKRVLGWGCCPCL